MSSYIFGFRFYSESLSLSQHWRVYSLSDEKMAKLGKKENINSNQQAVFLFHSKIHLVKKHFPLPQGIKCYPGKFSENKNILGFLIIFYIQL